MEQNGISMRFWGKSHEIWYSNFTIKLPYHYCMCKEKWGICEFHIDRSHETSRNENLLCLDSCESFWSVAFSFTVQIFKVKDTAM